MGKEKVTLGYLGYKFQTELINQILHPANKKFSDRIIDILHANYFDNEYFRLIIATVKDYFERFERTPTWDTLETILKVEIKEKITQDYVFEITKQIRGLEVLDWEFIQEKSLNFCRQQELKKANDKIATIISDGDFDKYEECAEIMKEALSVGAEKDDGTSISEGWDTVLEEDFRHPIPTGISGIDDLTDGGLSRGELGVVLAPYGVGKTTILTKMANTAYNVGYNVLQIVFEDIPDVIKRKHASCWSGVELNSLSDDKENVVEIIKQKTNGKENDLIIKKFTSEGITVNHIKSYIRHLISTGFKPDMIVLDYIDCVESARRYNDEWSGEGNVMRGFESMLSEYNMVGWTAVQGNRSSISSDVVTGDQMGGSIKKAQIGHFIMSVARTLSQKENNRATIAVLKSRFGKDGVIFEDCTFDNGRVYIDTETSDTFLGYEKKAEVRKEENSRERLKMANLRRQQRNTEQKEVNQ
jgi:replicative DNA helicase|tara:strand:- start:2804 stop:4219 length:1416 start_codon:yes stop_codon:yes gene_type:complete